MHKMYLLNRLQQNEVLPKVLCLTYGVQFRADVGDILPNNLSRNLSVAASNMIAVGNLSCNCDITILCAAYTAFTS